MHLLCTREIREVGTLSSSTNCAVEEISNIRQIIIGQRKKFFQRATCSSLTDCYDLMVHPLTPL